MRCIYWAAICFWVMPATLVFGHAAFGRLEDGAVGVQFYYEGDAPLRGAEIAVFDPSPESDPFVESVTDRHGRFAFIPDQPGQWRVEANDGMGHRTQLLIEVDEGGHPVATSSLAHSHHLSPWIVALSTLFGLFGAWTLWSHRKPVTAPINSD